MIRHAYNRVIFDQLPIVMSTRDNIIRLVLLTHNQMSAEIFRGLIRCTWHANSYVERQLEVFKTVDEVCFNIGINSCQVANCD